MEDLINRGHDEFHDWSRCVPYTSGFTKFRVVLCKKVLVEMDDRVAMALVPAVVPHNAFRVGRREHRGQVLHDPSDTFVQVINGNGLEYFP